MADERIRAVRVGDATLSLEEAIDRALRINVSSVLSSQHPNISSVKTLVLQRRPTVTKLVKCWDIHSTSTGQYKFSSLVFATLRLRKTKGGWWELQTQRSITLGDENNPDVVERLIGFLSSAKLLNKSGDYYILGTNGIDFERLSEALTLVSGAGQQGELLSRIFKWIQEDPQARTRLTQLSSDDLHRSQSLVAAINYGRYSKVLDRFETMVKRNLQEHAYQQFLQENHWLFGSGYSELLVKRMLVLGQQLDFPLRRTVDGYLEVIEIKTPLEGKTGFHSDSSHTNYYPGSEIHKNVQQVLNYLSALEANNYQILVKNKIDATRVRGKLIIGLDGCEEEQKARRLFNHNSLSVEVISFDGLIKFGQRVLDIMVAENPSLREIHSPREEIDDDETGEIPF